jgi:AGZA family xanthine/uracil permease-like MFS transporter
VRQAIINAVPQNLRVAIGVGIGLFIAFIGLKGTGLIVSDPATFITLGSVTKPETAMSLFGLVLTGVLMARDVQGSILIGIIATTVLSMVLGYSPVPHAFSEVISTSLPHMGETFGKLDIMGAWNYGILSIIFTFTVVELFDNMGTLIGLTAKAKLVKPNGEIENLDKALNTDAVGTIFSAVFGTSTVTSYIESAAGIAAGGKTGLTAVTVAVLFLVSLLFAPLIGLVPGFATAPPLILVGALMMSEVGKVNFADFTDGLPAFLTIIMMPLTSSIANGFAFGFISFAFMKTLAGKPKEVSPIMWLVSIAFMINLFMRA